MSKGRDELRDFVRVLAPALRPRPRVPKRHSRAERRDLAHAMRWNRDRNIVGFGIGPKSTNNVPDFDHHALVVFVVKKLGRSRVPREALVPRRMDAVSLDRRLSTDVVEVGTIPRLQGGLGPGTNAAHFTMLAGSITAAVVGRNAPTGALLLSCCHVFAPLGASGRQIESPPDASATAITNAVANLTNFVPLRPGGTASNVMDAALAQPIPGAPPATNIIPNLGAITSVSPLRSGQFLPAGIRQAVGIGAISGLVRATIVAERVATLLADPAGRVYLFQDLVAYAPSPLTRAGDSGMPIVRNTGAGFQLLGMHIGAGRIANTQVGAAFFVPAAPVFQQLGIALAS